MYNLLEELKKYKPYDSREKQNVVQVLNFLKNNKNAFERFNLSGHITAGALVCDKKGNILLNHHKKSDMWCQFGGHSDGDSHSLSVAKKEVFEETGIGNFVCDNKIFDVDIQNIPFYEKKNEPAHFHYDINYLFLVNSHNFKMSNESSEIRWVTIEQAKLLAEKDDYAMLRMLEKYQQYINLK